MNSILVTGITGQLGQELQQRLQSWGNVTCVGRDTLDLTKPEQIAKIVREINPNIIINAAAYTAVDKAENDSDLAKIVNAVAPAVLAEVAQELGARLIHVSTDYVFDGQKNTPYSEEDTPNPVSVYGKTKLAGESAVQKSCDRSLILRTAWVYSTYGKGNFVKTMLRLSLEREEVRVVYDQVGSPTWAQDIAGAIANLIQHPDLTGVYHYTNSGVTSWYDFAVAIFEEAKLMGFPLTVQRVIPILTKEYPTPAQRPAYSVLDCAKISTVLVSHPPHWREGLRKMLQLYRQTTL